VVIAESLVAGASSPVGGPFAVAIVDLGILALVGWVAALLLPTRPPCRRPGTAPA
jgi:hypothetical protein